MLVKFLSVFYTLGVLMGCARGQQKTQESNKALPLTKEQHERFELTSQNVGYVVQWQDNQLPSISSMDPNEKSKIESEIFKSCEFEHIEPEVTLSEKQNPSSLPINKKNEIIRLQKGIPQSFAFHIAGPKCPIRYSILLQNDLEDQSEFQQLNSIYGLTYNAVSDLSKSMDIQSFNFNWGSNLNNSLGVFSGPISGKGLILSRSQGKIKLSLTGKLTEDFSIQPSEIFLTIIYEDGTVVELKDWLWQKEKNNKSSLIRKCSINDNEITPTLFENYLKNFGLRSSYNFLKKEGNQYSFNPLSDLNLTPHEDNRPRE